MAIIRKKIENLKPGKEYLVTVRAKNTDLNISSDYADSIRFVVPQDSTIPSGIQNLQLKVNFEKVMFIFDFSEDKDISKYEYELYNFNVATPPNLVSSGFNPANVFTISVDNSTDISTKSYWGRVRAVDTTGNVGSWTSLVASSNTPLITQDYISSLTASKITAGTIGAHTITMNGANSIIKSSTFNGSETSTPGYYTGATTGWLINGLGKSYFYDATIVGSIDIGGFDSGSFHVDTTGNMWLGSGTFAGAPFRVSSEGALDVNIATPSQSFHIDKFGNMWSGSDTYGAARFKVNNQGSLITSDITVTGGIWTGGVVGGLTTGSDKIYITSSPVASYADVNTQFFVDNTGRMSLRDKFQWDGSNLTINGSISATTGSIGGWSIGSSSLIGGNASLASSGILTLGTGNDVVILSAPDTTYRIWAGHATPGSAAFSVTKTGQLTASNAAITGVINATSGNFTSTVTIGSGATSGQLTVGTNVNNIKIIGTNTANTTAIYSGTSTYGSGGFWLDASGRFSLGTSGSGKSFTWDGTDTTISGSNIIGGTIKTSANTGNGSVAGVIIDATSARFYNSSSGTPVTTISTADGSITSTNGTFTGSIFRTGANVGVGSPNAGAGVIFDSSGIRGFSGTGTSAVFSLDTTGALVATNASITGAITANSGSIGGFNIGATLSAGSGSAFVGLNPAATPFFAGASNSTGTGAVFYVTNTGALVATNANIAGRITATTGAIGGWNIGSTTLTGTNATLSSTGVLTLGSANEVVVSSSADATYRLWVGNAAGASAPFSVTKAGVLSATGASISGTITATTGAIGGWNIGSTTLTGTNATLSSTGVLTLGSANEVVVSSSADATYRLWVGNAAGASAPFSVTKAGVLSATGASISGTITATTGAIGGWNIGSTTLTGTNATLSSTGVLTLGSANEVVVSSSADATYRLWVGNAAGASAPFSVTKAGELRATAGLIGGFTIGATTFSAGTSPSIVGLNPAATPFFAGATGTDGSGAKFSVTNTGLMTATAGSIGGWTITSTSLAGTNATLASSGVLTLGTGNNVIIASAADAIYSLWAGNSVASSAPFSVTKAGALFSTSGTIGGWSLSSTELFSGTGLNRVSFNSSTGVIAVGSGNHGSVDTGFYVDKTGKFSLSNQLIFNPASGSVLSVKFIGNVASGSPIITSISALDIAGLKVGMAITGTGIQSGSYIISVGASSITLNLSANATNNFVSLSAVLDDFSELQVVGKIKGVIESTNPIVSPRLSTTTVQIVVSGTSPNQTATITTAGHAFITNEKILIENLPSTNGLNNLNREFVISNVVDSVTLTISLSGVTGVTSATTSTTAGVITLRELTMGLHPAESIGTSYEHTQGTGIRLDRFNWWLTNNQFRVGTSGAYVSWNGTKFIIQGGGSKTLRMSVGSLDADNSYAIVNIGSTPTYANSNTPFYADGSGRFSIADKVTYSGNLGSPVLTIDGTVVIGGTAASTVVSNAALGGSSLQPGSAANDVNNNVTTISGGKIRTGSIQSTTYTYTSGNFSDSGTQINLDAAGYIRAKNFAIDSSGNAFFKGDITASSGTIGGFNIAATTLSASSGPIFVGLNPAATPFFAGASNSTGTGAVFYVTNTGALVATNANIAGRITATTGAIGGWNIGSTTLTGTNATLSSTGVLTLGSANEVVVSSSADATYRLWVGNAAGASAPFSVTKAGVLSATGASISGTITATTGAIGGWNIGSTTLTGTNATLSSTGVLTLGSANEVVVSSSADATYRLWVGNAAGASAPFSVTKAGVLSATGASISGTITATTGAIGGWNIGSTTLTGTNATLSSTGVLTLGSANEVVVSSSADATYRLWVGNAAGASAPFSVTKAGVLSATGASISGAINATTGTIGGFNIDATTLSANSSSIFVGLYPAATPFFAGASNSTGTGAKFSVTNTGVMTATNANITGGNIDFNSANPANSFHVNNTGQLWTGDSTFTNAKFRVDNSGVVRIGSTSSALYINSDGAINIGSSLGTGSFQVSSAGTVTIGTSPNLFKINTSGVVEIGNAGSTRLFIGNDGSITIGTGVGNGNFKVSALGQVDIGATPPQSFHIDPYGNVWAGANQSASPPFKLSNDGSIDIGGADSTSVHISAFGDVYAGTQKAPLPVSAQYAITSITGTNTSELIITATPNHDFVTGQRITISGVQATPTYGLNTIDQVVTVIDSGTFKVPNPLYSTVIAVNVHGTLANTRQYKTAGTHRFRVGHVVTISGITPSGYNGTYVITGIESTDTFNITNTTTGTATFSNAAAVLQNASRISGGAARRIPPFSLTASTGAVRASTVVSSDAVYGSSNHLDLGNVLNIGSNITIGNNTIYGTNSYSSYDEAGKFNFSLNAVNGFIGRLGADSQIQIGGTGVTFGSLIPLRSVYAWNTPGAAGANVVIDSSGLLQKTGSSSIRYKKDVKKLDTVDVYKILDLEPVTFKYKNGNSDITHIGLIAEQVAEIEPRLVYWIEDEEDKEKLIPETVFYDKIIAPLILIIKDLNERISKLEDQ